MSDLFVDLVPFVLYSALLLKSVKVWRQLRSRLPAKNLRKGSKGCTFAIERRKTNLLMAILLLLTLCTLAFMASNLYALIVMDKTLLSIKVFQMFVISNCAVYWLVLDLIIKDAT